MPVLGRAGSHPRGERRQKAPGKLALFTPHLLSAVLGYATLIPILSAVAQTPTHPIPPGMTCPGDKLVWLNTRSHIYHFQGERYFGSTNLGNSCVKGTRIGRGIGRPAMSNEAFPELLEDLPT